MQIENDVIENDVIEVIEKIEKIDETAKNVEILLKERQKSIIKEIINEKKELQSKAEILNKEFEKVNKRDSDLIDIILEYNALDKSKIASLQLAEDFSKLLIKLK